MFAIKLAGDVLMSGTVCEQFRYIHGIQMLPLSPALMLARSPKFNKLEWRLGNSPEAVHRGSTCSFHQLLAFGKIHRKPLFAEQSNHSIHDSDFLCEQLGAECAASS